MADLNINVSELIRVHDYGYWADAIGWNRENVYATTNKRDGMPLVHRIGRVQSSRAFISTEEAQAGGQSLAIPPGGVHEVWYACATGTVNITVYCKYEAGANPYFEVADQGGEVQDSDTPSGDGSSWEQLSLSFTATKGIYIVRMGNTNVDAGGSTDALAFFDTLA